MLTQLLQTLNRKQSNCTLAVTAPIDDVDGYVYVKNGEIVAASLEDQYGPDAIDCMLTWPDPTIAVFSLPNRIISNVSPEASAHLLHNQPFPTDESPTEADQWASTSPFVKQRIPFAQMEYIVMEDDTVVLVPATEHESSEEAAPVTLVSANECESEVPETTNEAVLPIHKAHEALQQMMAIDGALSVALVDWTSGMVLDSISTVSDVEVAAADNANVVCAQYAVMHALGLTERIEDLLVTLEGQYHLIRGSVAYPNYFMYLELNRDQGNLALARYQLSQIETSFEI